MNKLINKLAQLDKSELIEFIVKLHSDSPELQQKIELFASKESADEQIKLLKKRIQSVKRGTRLIDYRHTRSFCSELHDIADSIAELVSQNTQHKAVFELADAFMQSHEKLYERADDSSGYIGDIFHESVDTWLTAAKQLRLVQQTIKPTKTTINWQDEVLQRFNNNGYSVWDYLLENTAVLLSTSELENLAIHFENTARNALKNPPENDRFGYTALRAQIGLKGVGQALNNPELIEKGTLLGSPEPNELQKQSLAEMLLNLGHAKRALTWLQGSWPQRHGYEQQKLLDACYQALGDVSAQLELRRQQYQQLPNHHNLTALLEISSEDEREILTRQAVAKAQTIDYFSIRVGSLIELQASDIAADQVINNTGELPRVGYYALPEWAKHFAKNAQPLAASLCYRSLIDDILQSARSKAYHYAATYLEKLFILAPKIAGYQNHIHHSEYVEQLKTQHKRKSAFWARVSF